MWRVFIQQRRHKWGRRWGLFAMALALFWTIDRVQFAFLPLGLVLFLEAWEALGEYFGPEAGPALHLVPLSRAKEFGGRFLSVLFTAFLALTLVAGGGKMDRALGRGETAASLFSDEVLSFSLVIAILVQVAFVLALLFFLQTLGRLAMGPWKKRNPSLQLLLDYVILVPLVGGLALGAEILVPRLPVVFSPASFSLQMWEPEAWTSVSRFLWTYACRGADTVGLFEGEEGLWALPLALVILATVLLFTASAVLAEDRIDD